MRPSKAGNRYATALLQIAEELNKLQVVESDLKKIENILEESRDFLLFLKSPVINTEKKKKIITQIFHNKIDDLTFRFLLLLVHKNREALIPSIIKSYWLLLDERNGIVNAEITSVVTPTDEQVKKIKTQLEGITKQTVRLSLKTDETLIGGFVIKIKDTVFDGSILNQLNLLKKKFIEASTTPKSKSL